MRGNIRAAAAACALMLASLDLYSQPGPAQPAAAGSGEAKVQHGSQVFQNGAHPATHPVHCIRGPRRSKPSTRARSRARWNSAGI